MRRFCFWFYGALAFVAVTLSGCVKSVIVQEELGGSSSSHRVTLSEDALFLDANTSSAKSSAAEPASVSVYSTGDWYISVDDSALFDVSPKLGYANTTTVVTVTPKSANNGTSKRYLGDIAVVRRDGAVANKTIEVHQKRVPKSVTLAYFVGTDLIDFYAYNIVDMKTAVAAGCLGDDGALVIYRQTGASTANLYEIVEHEGNSYESIIAKYTNTKSTNRGVLSSVIGDLKSGTNIDDNAEFNVILSTHGWGWVPSTPISSRFAAGVDYSTLWDMSGPIVTRYIGGGVDGILEISELVDELNGGGTHIGYILFDSCFMSNIETMYRLKDNVDYIVASPTEVMGAGFPYEYVLPQLFTEDGNGNSFNLQGACEAYYNNCVQLYGRPIGTVAYCDTSKLDGLANAIHGLTLESLTSTQRDALQYYEGLYTHVFYDLGDYITAAAASGADLTDYEEAFDAAFPVGGRLHTEYFYTGQGSKGFKKITSYSGVSTSQPSTLYTMDWVLEPWAIAITEGVDLGDDDDGGITFPPVVAPW